MRPSLDRVLVTLTTERNWAYCAMGSSLLLAIGLLLRKKKTGPIHVAGSVLAPIAAVGICAWNASAMSCVSEWPCALNPSQESCEADPAGCAQHFPLATAKVCTLGWDHGLPALLRWGL